MPWLQYDQYVYQNAVQQRQHRVTRLNKIANKIVIHKWIIFTKMTVTNIDF